MTERPIIFSGPMVRAILAGTKTQTRRVLRDQKPIDLGASMHGAHIAERPVFEHGKLVGTRQAVVRSPYGEPGDRLWVRENWRTDDYAPAETIYQADMPAEALRDTKGIIKWRPSIHMPRNRCRLLLDVVAVRVERLLEISVDDSLAEGIEWMRCPQCHLACYGLPGWGHDDLQKTPIEAYWHLWDALNEERGYGRAKNPWVWVVEFKRA